MNLAPLVASEIVLLINILVSSKDATDDPVSLSYDSLSPPTIIRTRQVSDFKGQCSQTKDSYVKSRSVGTLLKEMKLIVSDAKTL